MTRTVKSAGTPFLRIQGEANWNKAAYREQVSFDDVLGGLRLGDTTSTAVLPLEPAGTFGGLTRPTGLAVGSDGQLFAADPNENRILTTASGLGKFVPLWETAQAPAVAPDACQLGPHVPPPPGVYQLKGPRGVAVSRDGDLVVADTGHHRLVVYTWPGLAVRHVVDLDDGLPWDLAYDRQGLLYVADCRAGIVRRFDRLWRADKSYLGGSGVLNNPRHLAVDDRNRLLTLDTGLNAIVELDRSGIAVAADGDPPVIGHDGFPLPRLDPALHRRTLPPALRLDADDRLQLPQEERPDCPAIPLAGVSVDRRGRLSGTGVMLLARPLSVRYPRAGRQISGPWDSERFDCRWHRLVLEADVPATTTLTIRTLTASAPWDDERLGNLPDSMWSLPLTIGPADAAEILVQSPPGRYLWADIQLHSGGEATPVVSALTIYAPRRSSLDFLPPVFQEDPVSADFLDRFLSYFDTVFEEIESQIERFTGYLDPDGAPAGDFLAWLGSWLDLDFLAEWSDALRREFVRRAIGLYRQRGTIAGLQALLRLHTGLKAPQPIIIEHFRLRNLIPRREKGVSDLVDGSLYVAGQPLTPASAEIAHHFTVVLPSSVAPDLPAVATLHRLIDAQKPAHTQYQLRLFNPGVRIGCQSTVGVDMVVGPYPSAPLGEMVLCQSSLLKPPTLPAPRLGLSRLTAT